VRPGEAGVPGYRGQDHEPRTGGSAAGGDRQSAGRRGIPRGADPHTHPGHRQGAGAGGGKHPAAAALHGRRAEVDSRPAERPLRCERHPGQRTGGNGDRSVGTDRLPGQRGSHRSDGGGRVTRRGWGILSLLLVGSLLPAAAGAQLPNPSAVALGMGENHAALARGYSAISTNPAGLGAPGGPGSSFALLSVRGIGGIGPVGLDELDTYEGGIVPESVRREWWNWIVEEGSQSGSAGAELTFLAAHVGRIG